MKKGIHIIRALYPVLTRPWKPRVVGQMRRGSRITTLYDKDDRELVELQNFQRKLEREPAK